MNDHQNRQVPLTKPQNIFRQLVASNLLVPNAEGHGGLQITAKGRTFLKDKSTLSMRHHVKTVARERPKRGAPKPASSLTSETDQTLYENLKAARSALAKTQKVPAYVIFHDKTLVELAQHKPNSLEAMLGISGIGEAKLKRYGKSLLDVIIEHDNAAWTEKSALS